MKGFRDAIFDGDVAAIRQYAAERPRLLQQSIDADGNTALGLAILLSDIEIVKTLLELGSNPNVANAFDGNHPLVFLAKQSADQSEKTAVLADILLNAGSDPLSEVQHQADSATRIDATQTPSYHETPLLCSVRFQNETLLKKMIEHEVDVNSLNPETGTSALMLAATLGYLNICNILLDGGADLHAYDHAGNTPLHLAAQGYGEQVPVVQALLERGGDATVTNEDGFTPAMLAKKMDKDACWRILESHQEQKKEPPAYQDLGGFREEQKGQHIFSYT